MAPTSARAPRGRLWGRVEQTGVFVALANAPLTFQRTVAPRSALDQGIVTGLATAAHYSFAALIQDSIEAATLRASGASSPDDADPRRWRRLTIAADCLAMAAGFAAQFGLRQHPKEPLARSTARTAGHWVAVAAFSGLVVRTLEELLDGRGGKDAPELPPVGLPAGMAMASFLAYRQRRREGAGAASVPERRPIAAARSLAIGAGVGGFAAAIAAGERAIASGLSRGLARFLPGDARFWRPAGHAGALFGLAVPAYGLMHRAYHRLEAGAERIESAYPRAPRTGNASGGPGSLVPWETLSKHGRRFVYTYLRPDWIEAVIQEPAKAEPIRVFVGLDSARTERDRVDLALRELKRTGGLDRELLLVVSPTGTGYVNPVVVEAAEYMTRGDMATVVIQYSLRPSVLSLGRRAVGRRQHGLLLDRIHGELRGRPAGSRPRVVLYGESLGAWASQDVFGGSGVAGLEDLGVARAIWTGTPTVSRWRREVLDSGAPEVAVFNDFGQLQALDAEARSRLRFVMVTHDSDVVALFSPTLLLRQPDWLGPPEARPAGVPSSELWQTPTTFLQTLIDMKNSVHGTPGALEARGHDYRADLARFVREVYALDASDERLSRIEDALLRYEVARATWLRGQP